MHKRHGLTAGFTIVELLIVIVVIAILATISIVAYRGIQERARASEATSGLAQAKKKLELYKVDNSIYPTSGNLASAGVTDTDVSYQYTSDGSTYCLTATVGTTSYKATNVTSPEQGGCAGHGQGGQAAITNLTVDPRITSVSNTINSNNNTENSITKNVTVPATPDGITTALESRYVSGAHGHVLSTYNVDGLANTSGITRSVSAWVRVNASGYRAYLVGQPPQDIPANTWMRIQTGSPLAGTSWSGAYITNLSGAPSGSDRGYITGIMTVQGSQNYSFSDGNSPNWIWNGTPNNSTSTGPSL